MFNTIYTKSGKAKHYYYSDNLFICNGKTYERNAEANRCYVNEPSKSVHNIGGTRKKQIYNTEFNEALEKCKRLVGYKEVKAIKKEEKDFLSLEDHITQIMDEGTQVAIQNIGQERYAVVVTRVFQNQPFSGFTIADVLDADHEQLKKDRIQQALFEAEAMCNNRIRVYMGKEVLPDMIDRLYNMYRQDK